MRIILAQWSDGRMEGFTSVTSFLSNYPGRNYDTIMSYISRKNEPYKDSELTLTRVELTRAAGGSKKENLQRRKLRRPKNGV